MYLFDTDVLSNVVKKAPSAVLLARLTDLPGDMQFTTAINAAEIYYGAARSEHREEILKAFEEKVFPGLTILPFDAGSAKVYGALKASLERKGTVRSEPDLRIAAIAIQRRLTLVTGNVRHFEAIPGLRVEDWINPSDSPA
jgi:predicted nucleic acid-binding protein